MSNKTKNAEIAKIFDRCANDGKIINCFDKAISNQIVEEKTKVYCEQCLYKRPPEKTSEVLPLWILQYILPAVFLLEICLSILLKSPIFYHLMNSGEILFTLTIFDFSAMGLAGFILDAILILSGLAGMIYKIILLVNGDLGFGYFEEVNPLIYSGYSFEGMDAHGISHFSLEKFDIPRFTLENVFSIIFNILLLILYIAIVLITSAIGPVVFIVLLCMRAGKRSRTYRKIYLTNAKKYFIYDCKKYHTTPKKYHNKLEKQMRKKYHYLNKKELEKKIDEEYYAHEAEYWVIKGKIYLPVASEFFKDRSYTLFASLDDGTETVNYKVFESRRCYKHKKQSEYLIHVDCDCEKLIENQSSKFFELIWTYRREFKSVAEISAEFIQEKLDEMTPSNRYVW